MKVIDKLAWIYLKDGKILSTLSKGKTKFYIPGGKREKGENDHEALIREIHEELSVNLHENSLKHLETFQGQADGHAAGIEVKMTCYTGTYSGTLMPDSEIEKIVWLTYEDIHKVSPVDKIIFRYLKEKKML